MFADAELASEAHGCLKERTWSSVGGAYAFQGDNVELDGPMIWFGIRTLSTFFLNCLVAWYPSVSQLRALKSLNLTHSMTDIQYHSCFHFLHAFALFLPDRWDLIVVSNNVHGPHHPVLQEVTHFGGWKSSSTLASTEIHSFPSFLDLKKSSVSMQPNIQPTFHHFLWAADW